MKKRKFSYRDVRIAVLVVSLIIFVIGAFQQGHQRTILWSINGALTISFYLTLLLCEYLSKPTVEQHHRHDFVFHENMTGEEYEKFVAAKLASEGYTDISLTKATGDHGCDILAVNPQGLSVVIQCKRYSGAVGVHAVEEVDSARNFYKRTQAIVITNSTFTPAAILHASRTDVILIENYI